MSSVIVHHRAGKRYDDVGGRVSEKGGRERE